MLIHEPILPPKHDLGRTFHLTVFLKHAAEILIAEIPYQTFGKVCAPYHVLQWLIHPRK